MVRKQAVGPRAMFEGWTDTEKRNAMIAAAFVVIIVVLLVILLCKWPPSTWGKGRRRQVHFADEVEVREYDTDEGPMGDADDAAPAAEDPLNAAESQAIGEDQALRDVQNRHALQLRGSQMRHGAPTTSAMLFGSHNTRLEMSPRESSGPEMPPEAANPIPA